MMHGSSTTKTIGRDAGVGATAQRGKLENDDLSDTSPPACPWRVFRDFFCEISAFFLPEKKSAKF